MSVSLKKYRKYLILLIVTAVAVLLVINSVPAILKIIYPIKYKEIVLRYSKQYKVDPYLVFSIIKAESNFNEKALSHKNARGLMQITEGTGEWIAEKLKIENFKVEDLYDPEFNIRCGCWYLKNLEDEFGRNEEQRDFIILAYNGGRGNVKKWIEKSGNNGGALTDEQIPFKETRNYLKKVKEYNSMYKKLYENII